METARPDPVSVGPHPTSEFARIGMSRPVSPTIASAVVPTIDGLTGERSATGVARREPMTLCARGLQEPDSAAWPP